MRTYDRYLLSQLLTLFGFFSIVLVAVYWVNRAVSLFDRLIADGQSAIVFLEFSALALPSVIRVVLPIAAFAAAVYVTNRMRGDSELVVASAAGLSPLRLARAVLVFGAIAAVLTGVMTHVLTPLATARLDQRSAEIAQDVTAGLLSDGQFLHPVSGVTVFIADITEQGELSQVFLSDRRASGSATTYSAERAALVRREGAAFLVMFDGMAQTLATDTRQLSVTRFDDFAFDIGTMTDLGEAGPRDLDAVPSLAILTDTTTIATETDLPRQRVIVAVHERMTGALQSLVAPVLGIAAMLLGGFSRFSAWRQVTAAITALIGYELLQRVALDAVLNSGISAAVLYAPTLVFALLALVFLWLAGRGRSPRGRAVPA
ncbi:Lipopolysaccharide export system permease protein LptF [Rhodobacteraceae bacterium THAF1]|uniref:LPS export ABC transporter permease LptF n=1 Tax=Palleronia sp. THAF1 TaxID=2587842 RepID=UPI000F3E4404|nr:LPS export ABC transporter permease LptF [Palleronia sp. THAF1]QFU09135.1 Lipopolysaccharide export system permease protein LptF [Palleronia sp. THAF1]VDC24057.1 Lipopolysaccharide export system permease protein LptF [Rhodobacteraceae bacterium THAF1]